MKRIVSLLLMVFLAGAVFAGGQAGPETVKIGAVLSVTGPAAFLGLPEKNTLEMAVADINANGGIKGTKIELIIKDSQGASETALSMAKVLVEEEEVFAIIGTTRSGTSMAIKDFCEENETIMLSCASAEDIVNPVAKWVFKTPQNDSLAAEKIFQTMNDMGISKIGVVVGSTGFGNLGNDKLKKYAPEYGIDILISEVYDAAGTDFTAVMTKVNAQNVEAVVNWSIVPAQSIIPKNMKQLGMDVPLFQSHGFGNIQYVKAAGEAAEGILFPCGRLFISEDLPATNKQKKFMVDYKKAYEAEFGEDVSTFGGHAYDALMILVNAIKKAGFDKEKVRDAIETTKNFAGTGGVFNFSPEDHNGLKIDAFEMLTVKDGKFVLYKP